MTDAQARAGAERHRGQPAAADTESAAQDAAAIAAGRHPVAEAVGPCYDTAGLSRWLGISRQAIAKRVEAHTLLGCPTLSGARCYPALQFDDLGNTIPHLPELLNLLARPGGEWCWRAALWMATRAPYLPDDASAADWLKNGGDPAPVLTAARDDAERWAQ